VSESVSVSESDSLLSSISKKAYQLSGSETETDSDTDTDTAGVVKYRPALLLYSSIKRFEEKRMRISEKVKHALLEFLRGQRSPELLSAYLFYLERAYHLQPVVFVRDKIIYQSPEEAVNKLEKEGKIWRETEIKIGYGPPTVNEQTKKIYICPFTGKVFADNTHPNPQDAIYEWVSKCPQNTERLGGVPAKRFFVSEDPEVIKNYIQPRKEPITKTVYSSSITGKLYNSKESIIRDFKEGYLKAMTLPEVQNQSRYQLEESFLNFLQGHLQEDKIASFIEALAEDEVFHPFVKNWVETDEAAT